MKIVSLLGLFVCMHLPMNPISCEHLYLKLIHSLYKTFENIILKVDRFKIMNYKRDLARYRAYKYLLHNFTGRMDNMWLGKGANDPTERKRRLLNRMEGVEGNEYYTKLPRLYQCRNEGFTLKGMKYSLKYQHLRKWNWSEDARQYAKSVAALIPELNLSVAHRLFDEWDGRITTSEVPRNRTTRPWIYGADKASRKANATAQTPQRFPRRALTIHLLWRYTGVFAVHMPSRYPSFTNPPGFIDRRVFRTTWEERLVSGLHTTRRVTVTWKVFGRHVNTTGIQRRQLYKGIPQVLRPRYPNIRYKST